MKKLLILLIAVFIFTTNVSAASLCTYSEQSELNSKVANIKVSYDVVENKVTFTDGESSIKVFKIQILNVTEDFYIIVKNDINEEEKTYYSTDAVDGIISFEWDYAETVTNFTIQVYTTNKTNCANEKYKTIYLTTPRYNRYVHTTYCQHSSDFYLCQEFVTFSEISREDFVKKMNSFIKGEINSKGEEPNEEPKKTLTDKIFNFVDDNKWYIIGGLSGIIIISFLIYKLKSKKQRELGL